LRRRARSACRHQERKFAEQGAEQHQAAVAILDIGGMDDGVEQETERIDEKMPLLALDQLAGIEPVWIDARAPFSALLTL
jgi:hypothetical protein